MLPPLPEWLLEIWKRLEEAGHPTYLVGGAPRDLLLGRVPLDWDLGTAARPEEVLGLFPGSRPTGIRFGTVTVGTPPEAAEVTTLRREGRYLDHRHPSEVVFTADIREDLARRDFTVNALAVDLSGVWIDPFGGAEDLRRRRLRAVGIAAERFREDPLRLFRGIRIAGELGLSWETETRRAFLLNLERARHLARERIWAEVERIFRQPERTAAADLIRSGLLGLFLPGARPPRIWPDGLAARLCRIFPKGLLPVDELRGLGLPGSLRRELEILCRARRMERRGDRSRHRFLREIGERGRRAILASGDPGLRRLRADISSGRPFETSALAVGGEEVRRLAGSGPLTGAVLTRLLEEVWEDPLRNERGYLLGRVPELLAVLERRRTE